MNYPTKAELPAGVKVWRQGSSYALRSSTEIDDLNTTSQMDPRLRSAATTEAGIPPNARPLKEPPVTDTEMDTLAQGQSNDRNEDSKQSLDQLTRRDRPSPAKDLAVRTRDLLFKFGKMIGPGFMISVAYIDPGNYATDIAAGASYKFQLLVMVLFSNLIAIFLQALCIKLGSVTGLNLAENCHAHLPRWLNYVLWFFAESAIIATDIAEVIGTAIALNLLLNIPLVAGCAISILDVLIILMFYNPEGAMKGYRFFEVFITALVIGVVICFAIELSMIVVPDVRELFRGFAPSSALVQPQGLYQACGILGATVMPHGLYLGSGLVQPRLRQYDIQHGNYSEKEEEHVPIKKAIMMKLKSCVSLSTYKQALHPIEAMRDEGPKYRPSVAAIKACMSMSIWELGISLFTFALFVNSAILIVAGASLSDTPDANNADLFGIYDLLQQTIGAGAGTVFALALFLSGTSAGIVCTMAGQMVCEGQLKLKIQPWVMRLLTRSISITPSIIIAGAVGRQGVSAALEASQVALSVILPFTSAPLIYFTCCSKIMTVHDGTTTDGVKMRNSIFVAIVAVVLWLLLVVMNVALLVLAGLGLN